MKKIYTTLVAIVAITQFSYAQNSNPWPTSGSVGIGTNSPTQTLDVRGQVKILSSGGTNGSRIGSDASGLYMSNDDGSTSAFRLYAGSGNPLLFFINSSGNTGIGASTLNNKLVVNGDIAFSDNNNSNLFNNLYFGSGNFRYYANGYGASISLNAFTSGDIDFRTAGNNTTGAGTVATPTSRLYITNAGYVGIGTTTPREALSVNGNIRSKQVKVELANWPDYVFKSTYTLPSLEQVKSYIDENHHLPDMPSEKEVKENGLNLGEINTQLTKKVEELTLYMIEKDNQVSSLQQQLNDIKQQLSLLNKPTTKITHAKASKR